MMSLATTYLTWWLLYLRQYIVPHLPHCGGRISFDPNLLMSAGVAALDSNIALGAPQKARKKGATHFICCTIYRWRGKAHLQLLPLKTAHSVFARTWLHQYRNKGGILALGYTALQVIYTHSRHTWVKLSGLKAVCQPHQRRMHDALHKREPQQQHQGGKVDATELEWNQTLNAVQYRIGGTVQKTHYGIVRIGINPRYHCARH